MKLAANSRRRAKAAARVKPCEACGAASVHAVHDLIETDPVKDDGQWYANYQPGAVHYYCDEHREAGRLTPRFRSWAEMVEWKKAHD